MELAVNTMGRVLSYGKGIGLPDGCTLEEVSDEDFEAAGFDHGGFMLVDGELTTLPKPEPKVEAQAVAADSLVLALKTSSTFDEFKAALTK